MKYRAAAREPDEPRPRGRGPHAFACRRANERLQSSEASSTAPRLALLVRRRNFASTPRV